jgi:hypothetical protein
LWGGGRGLLQGGSHRLGDQFQPGQVAHRGQDMGGIGALRAAFPHQPCLLETGQGEVEQAVGAIVLSEAVTEVAQHTVMEAWVVQVQGQGVLEIDAAAHRLGRLPVGQIEQELPARKPWPTGQARDRGVHHAGTSRGSPRRPIAR